MARGVEATTMATSRGGDSPTPAGREGRGRGASASGAERRGRARGGGRRKKQRSVTFDSRYVRVCVDCCGYFKWDGRR